MKKLLSIILVLTLMMALAACSQSEDTADGDVVTTVTDTTDADSETTDPSSSDVEETTEAVTTEASTTDTDTTDDLAVSEFKDMVMVSGDQDIEIKLSKVNYMVYQIKNYYETNYGPTVWDELTDDNLTVDEMILTEIKSILIRMEISEIMANEQGIELDADTLATATSQGSSLFASYPVDIAAQLGITEDLVIEVLVKEAIAGEIYDQMMEVIDYNETDIEAALAEDETYVEIMAMGVENYASQVRARHILISTLDEAGVALEGEALAEKLSLIEELRQRALDGEDFAALATEYTEDPGSVATGGEYTFGRGQMVPEFEEAAYALEVGGISEVVKTSYGYHILMLEEKIPATEEEITLLESSIESLRTNIISKLKYEQYVEELDALIESYHIVYDDSWATISMKNNMIN